MELIRHEMPMDFTIYDMSDLHLGSPNCSELTLQGVIKEIRTTKDAYVIFKGDAIEAITPNDKRYTNTCVLDQYKSPKHQADRVIELFRPIKDRILVWMTGNHELKLQNVIDFGRYMAESLDAPYGAYVCKIAYYHKKKLLFKSFHTHGMGSVNSHSEGDIQYAANRAASLKRKLAKSGIGDTIFMSRGHDHQLILVPPTVENKLYLTDNGKNIKQHYHLRSKQNAKYIPPESRWFATTGSFRRLYSRPGSGVTDYGEMAGFAPSSIGYVRWHVVGGEVVNAETVVP